MEQSGLHFTKPKLRKAHRAGPEIYDWPYPETWFIAPRYPDYQISDHNRIIGPRGFVVTRMDRDGYLRANFYFNKVMYTEHLHKLLCEAMHGPRPTPAHQTAHFPDPFRQNNRRDNLSWKTPLGNAQDRELQGTSAVTAAQAGEIKAAYEAGITQQTIGDKYSIGQPHVSLIVRGKIKGSPAGPRAPRPERDRCRRGHVRNEQNSYVTSDGYIECRPCATDRARERRQRRQNEM